MATEPRDPAANEEEGSQLRGSSLLLVGRVLAMGINFLTQILIIRYLSKADYGAFAYALSVVALVQAAIQLGLDRGLSRYVPMYDEEGDHQRLLGLVVLVVGVVTSLGVLVVVLTVWLRHVIADTLVQDPLAVAVLVILIGLAPVEALDNLLLTLLAAFDQTRAIFLRVFVVAPVLKLVVVAFLISGGRSVFFLAAGYVAAGILGLAVFWTHLGRLLTHRRANAGGPMRFPIVELLTFSLPLLTTDLVQMALAASDAIMLEWFGTVEDVASIRAVMPTAKLNQVVLTSFGILYVPSIARLLARGDNSAIGRRYWQTAAWVTTLSFPILALILLFSDELTAGLLGESYAGSAVILAVLSIGYYTNALFGFNGMTLNVFRAIGFVVGANLMAFVLNIALNLALIPGWGALGAAIATAATFVLHNVAKQVGVVRRTGWTGFGPANRRLYGVVAAAAGSAAIVGFGLDLHVVVRLAVFAIVSAAVLASARGALSLDVAFPRVTESALVRRWLKVGN